MGTHSDTLAKLAMARLARVDPIPYDPRTGREYDIVRVRIDSSTLNQPIANGNLVCNEQEEPEDPKSPYSTPLVYEIYENQLKGVVAMVETATEEDMARVNEDLDHHTREATGQGVDGKGAKNTRGCYPSFPASFRHVMRRDMLPFRSVEVIAQPKAKRAATG